MNHSSICSLFFLATTSPWRKRREYLHEHCTCAVAGGGESAPLQGDLALMVKRAVGNLTSVQAKTTSFID